MTQQDLFFRAGDRGLKGQKRRIYLALKLALRDDPFDNGGWLPNFFFANDLHILKYTGRISELRQAGVVLEEPWKDDDRPGVFWYKLRRP